LQKTFELPAGHAAGEAAHIIQSYLKPRLSELAACRNSGELHTCAAYRETAPHLERVLNHVQIGGERTSRASAKSHYRILAWNIERGKELKRQLEAFRNHPYLKTCDVLLLTETDVGMARSGNVDVARTIAAELGMEYAFAPCYLSLVKGSGIERDVAGENALGLHGNAILSRYPILETQSIALENGIDKLASKEKRLGRQTAVAATIALPDMPVTMVSVHLDANSAQRHRAEQMQTILDAVPANGPVLLGGDWNTTTFNSSSAFHAIMGYFLRVLMGPDNVIRNHYLHPYRRFEKQLFDLLESREYEYRKSNVMGAYTIYYDVEDLRTYKGLAEWIPGWCFPFIKWALRNHQGRCPLKIDWFATRGLRVQNPCVIHDLREGQLPPLSDHDAIGVEIVS